MKTPRFWRDENVISFLLYPLSLLYGFFRGIYILFSSEYKTDLKIICVGNVTVGGSGKTPMAIEIGKILKREKIKFAYLSKGYKGKIKDFTKVDLMEHKASDVGDEPLLLAEITDTFVCKSRKAAIEKLSKVYNYKIIVMDDGFQNPTIYKNKNIVIIDGEYGIGNGELLPSGPMRESLENAIKRTSFFVIIGQDKQHLEEKLLNKNIAVIRACICEKDCSNGKDKYVAFCGLGRPEKFFNSLKNANYNVIKELSFGDHYNYSEEDLKKITAETEQGNLKIITTKKDWVKLSEEYRNKIEFLDVELKFYNNDEFVERLLK